MTDRISHPRRTTFRSGCCEEKVRTDGLKTEAEWPCCTSLTAQLFQAGAVGLSPLEAHFAGKSTPGNRFTRSRISAIHYFIDLIWLIPSGAAGNWLPLTNMDLSTPRLYGNFRKVANGTATNSWFRLGSRCSDRRLLCNPSSTEGES